jgi:hypothetical protein
MATSNNTVTDFGVGHLSDMMCLAAEDNAGTPHVWIQDGGSVKRFSPTIGSSSLNAEDLTYTGLDVNNDIGAVGTWQGTSYFWCGGGLLYQVYTQAATWATHALPTGFNLTKQPVFDVNRRKLYVALSRTSDSHSILFEYRNWSDKLANSGEWVLINDFGAVGISIYYDNASGILLIHTADGYIYRYLGDIMTQLDVIETTDELDTLGSWNSAQFVYYSGNYGFIILRSGGGQNYIVRIEYDGTPVSYPNGSGASIPNVLIAQYQITSATKAFVYLFSSLSPVIRSDGEFTVMLPT